MPEEIKVAVLGMGYVGLPVAMAFGEKYPTVGFDVSRDSINLLRDGVDCNKEYSQNDLESSRVKFSFEEADLLESNFYIVAVPTPIDSQLQPDLSFLKSASAMIGKYLSVGDYVIYESTVFPGATEELCIPELERVSGLKGGRDFKVGYSPERINQGDKVRGFTSI